MSTHWLLLIVGICIAILYFVKDIDAVMKKIIYFVAIVCTAVWFLGVIGFGPSTWNFH